MVTFRTEDFWQNIGGSAYQWSRDIRDAVLTNACQLWFDYPKWVVLDNPINAFTRGYLNSACSFVNLVPPAPQVPFTGGQCTTQYIVEATIENANTQGGIACQAIRNLTTAGQVVNVPGPVKGLKEVQVGSSTILYAVGTAVNGSDVLRTIGVPGVAQDTFIQPSCGNYGASNSVAYALPGTAQITNIIRIDGQPDNCGDPPPEYPDITPTSQDLSTTIIINNNDGVATTHNLVYNQIAPNYNFPMGFKLDGINITLDIGGITIHGAPQITSPTSNNDNIPPPGSDGGNDGVGGNNDTVYPDQQYPTLPELVTPETVETAIEYLLCTEGVLETINLTIQQTTSINPLATSILAILINIVQEICEGMEATGLVGLPEYYGLKPGTERPAIVFLWKEVIGNTIQPSTYSSTVHNPSAAAINAINTIIVPDKTIGEYMTSVTLLDGSRIRATGNTQGNADSSFFFLLNQVDGAFKQPDINDRITRSQNTRLQTKTLKCRQIEYYPDGKDANTSPSVRRIISIT